MASESQQAAHRLAPDMPRSAASRFYYASYQAMSALLLYQNLVPPEGREAWSHEQTPGLIMEHLQTLIRNRDRRKDIASRLAFLYKIRVSADYISEDDVVTKIAIIRRHSDFLLKIATDLLPL